ncbi:hypothetical protein HA48_03920 [Pantoea wallisii]|uniref:Phage tail tape measure protein n=1 Tax=Pantoea wallisii TaxID=1076551 RepID=A0A1X1DCS6_9GAMM|nr:hypothetical protein HA48_03920 [Pantoea wallisii]
MVDTFKATGPISEAFSLFQPLFQWIGDKVQEIYGWFKDLLTPVQSTAAKLSSAAAKGKAFGRRWQTD